jgi:sigma-E factor negative regulatory protein RseA
MKEKISALIDAELDELDERRTLDAMKHDAGLCATWERYHLIRGAITRQLSVLAPQDLSERVRMQIDNERAEPAASLRFWPLAGGFAAAASVALVAFLGFQAWRVPVSQPVTPIAAAPTKIVVAEKPAVGMAQTVATNVAGENAGARAAAEDRLHYYLFGHNEFMPTGAMGNMLPYVRVVSDSPEK